MTRSGKRFLAGGGLLAVAVAAVAVGRRAPVFVEAAPAYRRLGPPGARVVIREYSDFQCPRCADAHPVLEALRERHAADVRIVFHHMPLRQHRWAVLAAVAAESAGRQGKFWEYAARLYASQKEWSAAAEAKPFFVGYAKDLGISVEKFAGDMESPELQALVAEEKKRADAVPIPATPTFFINDRMLVGDSQLSGLGERFVRQELAR